MSRSFRCGFSLAVLYGAIVCVRIAIADSQCDGSVPQGASNCEPSQDCPSDCPKAGAEYIANKCQSMYRASNNYSSGCSAANPNSNTLCKVVDDGSKLCYEFFGCYHLAGSDRCEFDLTTECSFPQVVVSIGLSKTCVPGT